LKRPEQAQTIQQVWTNRNSSKLNKTKRQKQKRKVKPFPCLEPRIVRVEVEVHERAGQVAVTVVVVGASTCFKQD
jgi:hypothetical protein